MSPAGVAVAFAAGLVSFLAPCVLPLVPGYLSAVSSVEADRLGEPGSAGRIVLSSLPFVAGLVSIFVLLGAGAAAIGLSIAENQFLLEQIAGFVLIVFGLVFMGLLPWPERLLGAGLVQGARRRGSGFLLGGAFAICAAPCISPVLGSILVLAGDSGTVLEGSVLLAVYALGLAVPFLVAAALFVPAMGFFRRSRPLRDDPARQRRDPRRARRIALLRPLLVAPRLPEPVLRVAGSRLDGRRRQLERARLDDGGRSCDRIEHPRHVDAAVRRRIRAEPPSRLLELALAADAVAPFCLVPGNGDVDEPLEKVPFCRRRGAPFVLELLVGGEVGAGADQPQPLFQSHRPSI